MKRGWIYIMTNKPFGTLYVGVTSDLATRVWQHRNGEGSQFCKRHGLTRLVYVEEHARTDEAIERKKAMKTWKLNCKLRQIMDANSDWDDLFELLNH